MYLIGYDIGSSSIKAALVDAQTGQTHSVSQYPPQEMNIIAHQEAWAEQKTATGDRRHAETLATVEAERKAEAGDLLLRLLEVVIHRKQCTEL